MSEGKPTLRCSNDGCESNIGGCSPSFNTNLTIDEDCELDCNPYDLDGEEYTCNFCESAAEWVAPQ